LVYEQADAVANRVARFVTREHANMPDFLRLPIRALTLAFDAASIPHTGKAFHELSQARRLRQIASWRHSRMGFRRDLVRFYESLVIFGFGAEDH
jgi:hypothetical protein